MKRSSANWLRMLAFLIPAFALMVIWAAINLPESGKLPADGIWLSVILLLLIALKFAISAWRAECAEYDEAQRQLAELEDLEAVRHESH